MSISDEFNIHFNYCFFLLQCGWAFSALYSRDVSKQKKKNERETNFGKDSSICMDFSSPLEEIRMHEGILWKNKLFWPNLAMTHFFLLLPFKLFQ